MLKASLSTNATDKLYCYDPLNFKIKIKLHENMKIRM